jgi:hypothetical protein
VEESGCPDWDMAQPTHPQNKNTQAGRMTRSVAIGSRQGCRLDVNGLPVPADISPTVSICLVRLLGSMENDDSAP